MGRIVILSEELKKYFVLIDGEKAQNRSTKWKCNIDECVKIIEISKRIHNLKYDHINEFQKIDQKLPLKDVTKRLSGSIVKCVEKSSKTSTIFPHIEGCII